MRQTILDAPGQIRLDTSYPDPTIQAPTDAIVRVTAACICGSDLWPYGATTTNPQPRPIGHEAVGIVEEVGSAVSRIKPGDFVIAPFDPCDNTCPNCLAGAHNACQNGGFLNGAQAEYIRVVQADGSLARTPGLPDESLVPSLLTISDVMATGWHAAVLAGVQPGHTVVVVGDGAVGLCGVIAAKQLGADRIIAMSRHEARQKLATEFGATHIVAERGDEGVATVMELTDGLGADAVLECVGLGAAVQTSFDVARAGTTVGAVGAPQGYELPLMQMFRRNIGYRPGMAPVRRYSDDLLELVLDGTIDPGKVFDLELPLDDVADGYKAMADRTAIKVLLRP